jgi:putative transposase
MLSSLITIRDWPHAPTHRLGESGAYILTSGTFQKEDLFDSPRRLTFLTNTILESAESFHCNLQAWAVFSNHFHLILDTSDPNLLKNFVGQVHTVTARRANEADRCPQRKVWFQYWETHLTFHSSYLARLSYVHSNAMLHGLVRRPEHYPWCSAAWFERKASKSFYRTVMAFPCDQLNIPDNFECKQISQPTGA